MIWACELPELRDNGKSISPVTPLPQEKEMLQRENLLQSTGVKSVDGEMPLRGTGRPSDIGAVWADG
jgi:hypothetical protein